MLPPQARLGAHLAPRPAKDGNANSASDSVDEFNLHGLFGGNITAIQGAQSCR